MQSKDRAIQHYQRPLGFFNRIVVQVFSEQGRNEQVLRPSTSSIHWILLSGLREFLGAP
jgi:hypothetical protein